MLAKAAATLPEGDGWLYEPKWDGFRCIVPATEPTSSSPAATSGRSPATSPSCSTRCRCSFRRDAWSTVRSSSPRRRATGSTSTPCSSGSTRPSRGSAASPRRRPAAIVLFDLLVLGDRLVCSTEPLSERRRLLTTVLADPGPSDVPDAGLDAPSPWPRRGSRRFEGAGLDGVVAKRARRSVHAEPAHDGQGEARAHRRVRGRPATASTRTATASARSSSASTTTPGRLHHVGVAAAFTVKRPRRAARRADPAHGGRAGRPSVAATGPRPWPTSPARMPRRGATSRWNAGKDLSWVPIRVERVAEVTFGQLAERPVPPRRVARPLAPGPDARELHATTSWTWPTRSASRSSSADRVAVSLSYCRSSPPCTVSA